MSTTVNPLRVGAQSIASKAKAYKMLQSLQGNCIPQCLSLYATVIPEQDGWTVYVLLSELVTGKGLQCICKAGDVEDEVLAYYLCEKNNVIPSSQPCSVSLRFFRPPCLSCGLGSTEPRQGPFRGDGCTIRNHCR